jgi:hypothetical protein
VRFILHSPNGNYPERVESFIISPTYNQAPSGIALEFGVYYYFNMSTISLKLPDRLLKLLEEESRTRRTTKSSLVREYLERTLAARAPDGEASCYNLAQDLAGSVKGLPRDLATNPKYLEGFGR